MSTQDQARELMAQHRHHDDHLHESMRSRAEAEVNQTHAADAHTQEQARELMSQHRHHDEHLQESMLNRAEAELGASNNAANSSQE
ncbi:hypothetical protein [Coleofasciculus sp. H7-2]|uniref:hypothetical protein n=1 Tax=Coleofasciculus sp. H7-2 TaxID=3351545 RepID=UPI003671D002